MKDEILVIEPIGKKRKSAIEIAAEYLSMPLEMPKILSESVRAKLLKLIPDHICAIIDAVSKNMRFNTVKKLEWNEDNLRILERNRPFLKNFLPKSNFLHRTIAQIY